jgi:hypothetical protein
MCSSTPFDRFRRAAFGLTLVAALLSAAGCGKKGDPLPPLRTIPLPTTDLSVRQQGRLILFDLAYPSVTVSGLALDGIDALELYVMTKPLAAPQAAPPAPPQPAAPAPPAGAPPAPAPAAAPWPTAEPAEFEAAGKLLQRFSGADLQAAVAGDRLQFQLPLAEPLPATPAATIYAVRSVKGAETSAFSNRVTLVAREPMAPPRNLTVEPSADGIRVAWESDPGAQSFDVFRRDAQNKAYGPPIARVPGGERSHLDKGAAFGGRYIYTVRAVANLEPLVLSDPAGEREVGYEDRFAPPVPGNLIALGERGTVRLRWDTSAAPDLRGYLVFRRDPGRDFVRITPEPIAATEFTDRGLSSGLTFEYVVLAVDKSGNESQRSAPASTVTR